MYVNTEFLDTQSLPGRFGYRRGSSKPPYPGRHQGLKAPAEIRICKNLKGLQLHQANKVWARGGKGAAHRPKKHPTALAISQHPRHPQPSAAPLMSHHCKNPERRVSVDWTCQTQRSGRTSMRTWVEFSKSRLVGTTQRKVISLTEIIYILWKELFGAIKSKSNSMATKPPNRQKREIHNLRKDWASTGRT